MKDCHLLHGLKMSNKIYSRKKYKKRRLFSFFFRNNKVQVLARIRQNGENQKSACYPSDNSSI